MATGGAKLDTSHGHSKYVAPTLFRMGKIFVKKVQKVLFTMLFTMVYQHHACLPTMVVFTVELTGTKLAHCARAVVARGIS